MEEEMKKMMKRTAENRVILERTQKNQKPAWLLDFSMAERVGLEPTSP